MLKKISHILIVNLLKLTSINKKLNLKISKHIDTFLYILILKVNKKAGVFTHIL